MSKHDKKSREQNLLTELVKSDEDSLVVAEESALIDVEFLISRMLEASGVSQKELAQRLGVSEGRISQLTSADSNPTVKTLARVAHVLGRKIAFDMITRIDAGGELCRWRSNAPGSTGNQSEWTLKDEEETSCESHEVSSFVYDAASW